MTVNSDNPGPSCNVHDGLLVQNKMQNQHQTM